MTNETDQKDIEKETKQDDFRRCGNPLLIQGKILSN